MRTYFSIKYTSKFRRLIDPRYELSGKIFVKYIRLRRRLGLDLKASHQVMWSDKQVKWKRITLK